MKSLKNISEWIFDPIITLNILAFVCYVVPYCIDSKIGGLIFVLLGAFVSVVTLSTIAIVKAIGKSKESK